MIQADMRDERLYDTDAYLTDFDATVLAVTEERGTLRVVMDRTAFFPEGGGQLSDIGTLDGYAVTDVRDTARGIEHTVVAPVGALREGQRVHGHVDFEVRLSAMQCHTAEHILSGIIYTRFGYDNVGFHLSRTDMTLDTSGTLTKADIDLIEQLANRAVTDNRAVSVSYPTEEERAALAYRSKLDLDGRVRIVTVEGIDACACCAPHVGRTGEIGVIKITGFEKHRGGMRLYVQAGMRALSHYRAEHDELHRASALLSAHPSELASAVERLLAQLKDTTLLYKSALSEQMRSYAKVAAFDAENPVELFSDKPVECVRSFLNEAVARVRGILVVLMPKDGGFSYLLASEQIDLRTVIARINAALDGRGGGSARMVQGSFSCDEERIRSYFQHTSFGKDTPNEITDNERKPTV